MLIIYIQEEDKKYFNDLIDSYPQHIQLDPVKYFIGLDAIKLVVETSIEFLPVFLSALSIFLAYKANKIQEKELELHRREVQLLEKELESKNKNDKSKNFFEVKLLHGSERLIYTNEDLKDKDPEEILRTIALVLEKNNEDD